MPKKPAFSKSNSMLIKLPNKKQAEKDKKVLLSYLSSEYDITYFNKMFVFKLEHIHEGTLQNLQLPITYDILLDMFRYYKDYLDEQRVYNKKIDKKFSGQQGILSYDLAIILNKHSDYLVVLEEDKARASDAINSLSIAKLVTPTQIQKNDNKENINISDMLEDW